MADNLTLVGHDLQLWQLSLYGGTSTPTNMLGRWEDLTLTVPLKYADSTPSASLLDWQTLIGYTWNLTATHKIWSGGGYGNYMLFNNQYLVAATWQEEYNGAFITAYGGLSQMQYKRGREIGQEVLDIQNLGPVGNTNSSIFRTYGSAAGVAVASSAQTAALATTASSRLPAMDSIFAAPGSQVTTNGGLLLTR